MQGKEVGQADVPPGQPQASRPATRWLRWGLAALLVLAAVGFYALGLHRYVSWDFVSTNLDAWQALARDNLLPAVAVFFLVYVAATALSLPAATILTLVA